MKTFIALYPCLAIVAFFGFYLPPFAESQPLPSSINTEDKSNSSKPSPSKPQTHIHLVEDNDEARKEYFLRQKEHQLQWSANTGGRIVLDPKQRPDVRFRRFVIGSSDARTPNPQIMIKHMGKRSSDDEVKNVVKSEAEAQDSAQSRQGDEDFRRRLALAFMLSGGEEHRKPTFGASYGG
ncbi:hypothetical protein TCAL_01412 [Tigriopus californicus]|uniref:Uncharacterized protein n=1 Tax=Tigriopus californicus TaxID=6832 RepID=A0A553NUC2_TIGCA|nr:uncharacterized protein LOC131886304 [Tigriopus californicus]TRY69029.1 hypothetical protein TCAL_01412 [Tigriopus californicus]|eukprot:TCALIF_01412-PA protein Name:"Protein of unknown function" AED:0.00 eAED:0.00 QI:551/1/1/1/1/1/2/308/179